MVLPAAQGGAPFAGIATPHMRGSNERSGELFSYVDLEERVPAKHPLRLIRRIVNEVLVALDSEFAKMYADSGSS
jgi:hypothetical protein